MVSYIVRRLIAAVLILFGASFIVYNLTALSGDPLSDLKSGNVPGKETLIQQRTEMLDLNTPAPIRYFKWLAGAAQCIAPIGGLTCNLGQNLTGQPVTEMLGRAVGQTLLLVTGATILAIVIGVGLGIITALKQYSSLDYTVTFAAFLFFSLPMFWVAVLLKQFGAIGFNNFLKTPSFSPTAIAISGAFMGLIVVLFMSGIWWKRLIGFAVGFAVTAALMMYLDATDWFLHPQLGPVIIALFGACIAFVVTWLVSGLGNKRALYASLVQVPLGVIAYYVFFPMSADAKWWWLLIGAIIAAALGALTGFLFGGFDRSQGMRSAALTALLISGFVVLDRFFASWPSYMSNTAINNRPIATIGASTPNLVGDFWIHGLDSYTHLLLPTIALTLTSLASYSRYSRASMLEIMQQDYIRTARAKGVSERSVVMRHAFRNALIPISTVIALDIGGLIGGAVITESVFGFTGMGNLFIKSLNPVPDLNPVMGFFLVVGLVALVFNLVADLLYSVLDPRVRVKA